MQLALQYVGLNSSSEINGLKVQAKLKVTNTVETKVNYINNWIRLTSRVQLIFLAN